MRRLHQLREDPSFMEDRLSGDSRHHQHSEGGSPDLPSPSATSPPTPSSPLPSTSNPEEEPPSSFSPASSSFLYDFYKHHPKEWKDLLCNKQVILNTLTARVPITGWLFSYHKNLASNLKADILAAITVGFMLIPQSMAYALLAGLPPIYGLYAALMPLIIYTVRYEKLPTFFVLVFLLPPPPLCPPNSDFWNLI